MTRPDSRFGLPLSLPEALRADPTPIAHELAELIEDEAECSRVVPPSFRLALRPWQAVLTGLALSLGLGVQSYAAGFTNLEGRWEMTPSQSSFREAVTGPAPDAATLLVTRDDGQALAYQLIETRRGSEVGRGAYAVSFGGGAASTSSVDGRSLPVIARRDARGGVAIEAPEVGGRRAYIHLRRTGEDTAVLEHDVAGPTGVTHLETIALVRAPEKGDQP